jgi:hypothetical protein
VGEDDGRATRGTPAGGPIFCAMTDPLRPPYELGVSEARRSVGTWVVLTLVVVAATASTSLAAVMLGGPLAGSLLTETPVPDGPWALEWTRTVEAPAVEQARQLGALRTVAGGASALVAGLCLLMVTGLWLQRLTLRRPEHFVHWAVGARRVQAAARLAGEGHAWGAVVVGLSAAATALVAALVSSTFPGEASVSPPFAWTAVLLTALGVVLVRWESDSGRQAAKAESRGLRELVASPSLMGAIGVAALTGVGLLARHTPYAVTGATAADAVVMGASLASLEPDQRGDELVSWTERARAADLPVGLASAGTARATGHRDQVTTECGRCFEGTIPMPLKVVRAEVYAVAPDTFVHIGVAVTRGRDFDHDLDYGGPGVAVVSQALANRHFERGEPLGRRVLVGESTWLTVVGVVGDRDDVRGAMDYAVYVPLAQARPVAVEVIAPAPSAMESVLTAAAPAAVFETPRSRAAVFAVHGWFRTLLNAVGVVALGLLGAGLWVAARAEAEATRHEMSVRRALGASRRTIGRFYAGFMARRLLAAVATGAWLSLFLGAVLAEAYGSIPQIDWAVWGAAAAWVTATYAFGSAPTFLRAAREPMPAAVSESG